MRPFWKTVVPTTCGLAVLLIGGASYSPGQEKKAASQETEALKRLRKAAEQGDADAQRTLGTAYFAGLGVPQDYAEAVRWYRKAAEQGNAAAQTNLGTVYYQGQGVPQDYAEAVRWYRKAADQGYADAQGTLGFMCAKGEGAPQDYTEAHKWLNLAASRASGDLQKDYADARELVAKEMTSQQIAEA